MRFLIHVLAVTAMLSLSACGEDDEAGRDTSTTTAPPSVNSAAPETDVTPTESTEAPEAAAEFDLFTIYQAGNDVEGRQPCPSVVEVSGEQNMSWTTTGVVTQRGGKKDASLEYESLSPDGLLMVSFTKFTTPYGNEQGPRPGYSTSVRPLYTAGDLSTGFSTHYTKYVPDSGKVGPFAEDGSGASLDAFTVPPGDPARKDYVVTATWTC